MYSKALTDPAGFDNAVHDTYDTYDDCALHASDPACAKALRVRAVCRYYNAELHAASFVLPQFAKEALSKSLTYS